MKFALRGSLLPALIILLGLGWGIWFEWPEITGHGDKDEAAAPAASVLPESAAPVQAPGEERMYNFDTDTPGRLPTHFHSALTGRGTQGNWAVQADPTAPSRPNVLAQTSSDSTDYRFPLAIVDGAAYTDLDLSVKFKAVSGRVDRAGGLVFRLKDANNYYVVRANALEDNFNLYRVVNGSRREITGSPVKVTSGDWHGIRVEVRGAKIACYFDGTKRIETTDSTFKDAGKIGLWTKADSVTSFDDLRVTAK